MKAANYLLWIVKKIFPYLLIAIVAVFVYSAVIEWLFNRKKNNQPVTTQYWSHRGFNNAALPENSIAAFEQVINYGLKGIETDVYWQEDKQQFIISHDPPLNKTDSLLPLEQILARFKDSVSYWIDFKNLSSQNQKKAEQALLELSNRYELNGKLFVESGNGWALRKFKSENIKTLYWIQYNRTFAARWMKLLYVKTLIVCSSFDGYTSGYTLYNDDFKKQFNGLPLYLFDASATAIEKEKAIASTITVFLVDADYFQNKTTR
jgi:hypothetical protein